MSYFTDFKGQLDQFERAVNADQSRIVNNQSRIQELSKERAILEGQIKALQDQRNEMKSDLESQANAIAHKSKESESIISKAQEILANAIKTASQRVGEADNIRAQAVRDAEIAGKLKATYEQKVEHLKKITA